MLSYCNTCQRQFEGFFDSECHDCRRLRAFAEDRERSQNEAEARQREYDEAQRDRDRDEREREEEERRWLDRDRQEAASEARERAAELAEERREAALERQREQLANQWKYEAEAKLEQARNLHAAGANHEALKLADAAACLGLEAFALRGSIFQALGNTARYREDLLAQIGFLRQGERIPGFGAHKQRLLRAILELGGEADPLFAAYFDRAATWQSFPHGLQEVLEPAGALGSEPYRRLVLQHARAARDATPEQLSRDTCSRLVAAVLAVPNHQELLAAYLTASESWAYFPFELIEWLLAEGHTEVAAEVFNRKASLADEKRLEEFLWRVCPLGVELRHRGKQDDSWLKRFRARLEGLEYTASFGEACARAMRSNGLGETTKKQLREAAAVACKKWLRAQRAERSKILVAEALKGGEAYEGIKGPDVFAFLFGIGTVAAMWTNDGFRAVALGIVVFAVARLLRKRSNARDIAARRLWTETSGRAATVAKSLSLKDAEVSSALSVSAMPTYGAVTVKDIGIAAAISGALVAAFWLWAPNLKNESVASHVARPPPTPAAPEATRERKMTAGRAPEQMPIGNWEGNVTQAGLIYDVTMQLEADVSAGPAGSILYPSLRCSASLTLIRQEGPIFWLQESLRDGKGRCIDGGHIAISTISPNAVSWRYFRPGVLSAPLATATLTRSPSVATPEVASPRSSAPSTDLVAMASDRRTGCKVWKPSLQATESVYWSGRCADGQADGPGVAQWFIGDKETLRYEGSFTAGRLQGQGTMAGAGGDRYEGEFHDGKRDGRGIYVSASGPRYEGQFKDNKRHGTGTLTDANGVQVRVTFAEGRQLQ